MDSIDKSILQRLMREGRVTWEQLGKAVGLSPAAVAQRVKRLERDGVIASYSARVDPESVGAGLLAFVHVRFADPARRKAFLARVAKLPWIQECHHITGEMDYLLKIRCAGTSELERLITVELKDRCKVAETRTTIVLASSKDSTALDLGA